MNLATKRDYLFAAIIGFLFGVFSFPILKNLQVSFIKLNFATGLGIAVFFSLFAVFALFVAAILGKKIPVIFQVAKFSAVGAFNTFFDWGVLNLLILISGIAVGWGYAVFKGISFIAANIGSYFWNKHWTFSSSEKSSVSEFGKFFAVSVIGFVINIAAASFVVNAIDPLYGMSAERWANVGALAATVVSLIWNFTGYKFIVFKR